MTESAILLPAPRQVLWTGGRHLLRAGRSIAAEGTERQALHRIAGRWQAALESEAGLRWVMTSGASSPRQPAGLMLRLHSGERYRAQGYHLAITDDDITIESADEAGLFYGVCTLIQLLQQYRRELPCVEIEDWPDYPVRGVMLDISRDKVPTMETMLALVDMLAGWKINQFQVYTEHTFAYANHPDVWAEASPFTGQEIRALDAYCRERYVDLVPNQNSLGHMERWLKHPRYAPLAETLGEFRAPWGWHQGPFSLCPTDPGAIDLLQGLYDELLPHFSSRMFNVGCDETFDIGQGRSAEACNGAGPGRVYLDFLGKVHEAVSRRGRTMQFWADFVLQHPELIPELPRNTIALEWGYEAEHAFDAHCQQLAASGIPFYVCPGTSSWCGVAGRTTNALDNQRNAAENGLKHGASGFLNTDWGDRGHWQVLPVSYLGFAAGAALSWALDGNCNLDFAAALSQHAFHDEMGVMGRVAYDLGETYRVPGVLVGNSSVLFWLLQMPLDALRAEPRLSAAALSRTLEAIDAATSPMDRAEMRRPDGNLIVDEFQQTARLLRHACRRGLLALAPDAGETQRLAQELDQDMQEIILEYRRIWLMRNRPGGLADSVARLQKARQDYVRIQ